MNNFRTFADIKRALTLGSKWSFKHSGFTIRGNVGDTVIPAKDINEREVDNVQANAVSFKTGDKSSWFYFPKAKFIKVKDNGFDVLDQNDKEGKKVLMSYTFIC